MVEAFCEWFHHYRVWQLSDQVYKIEQYERIERKPTIVNDYYTKYGVYL